MLFSILQGCISGTTQLFIKGALRKWWDYHRIDNSITKIIKTTCEKNGFDFEDFLARLGITKSFIEKRLKEFKKSFKEKKNFTEIQQLIKEMIKTYFDVMIDPNASVIQKNSLDSKELDLVKKIKINVYTYLVSFKPAETIAYIYLNLKTLEKQHKEYYDDLKFQLNKISTQFENQPINLRDIWGNIENIIYGLNVLQKGHEKILRELAETKEEIKISLRKDEKITPSLIYNKLIDIKLGFKKVRILEKKIMVGQKFTINIITHSKIPFEINKIGVNLQPIDAVINAERLRFYSQKGGYFELIPQSRIISDVGQMKIASVDLWGPKSGTPQELYIMLKGGFEIEGHFFPFKKYIGPYMIERDSISKRIMKVSLKILDSIYPVRISKFLLKKKEEDKYL